MTVCNYRSKPHKTNSPKPIEKKEVKCTRPIKLNDKYTPFYPEKEKPDPKLEELFDQLVIAKENERLAKLAGDTLNENKILKEMIIQLIKENQKLKTVNKLLKNKVN